MRSTVCVSFLWLIFNFLYAAVSMTSPPPPVRLPAQLIGCVALSGRPLANETPPLPPLARSSLMVFRSVPDSLETFRILRFV
jgi:hypothetical protein